MEFEKGQKVYVKINWAGDNDCWIETEVIKETAKRVKVKAICGREEIGDVYFSKSNVKKT